MEHFSVTDLEDQGITSFDIYSNVTTMRQVREVTRSIFNQMKINDIRYFTFHTSTPSNLNGEMVRVQMDGMSEAPLAVIRVEINQHGNMVWQKMHSRREAYAYIRSILKIS